MVLTKNARPVYLGPSSIEIDRVTLHQSSYTFLVLFVGV